MNETENTECIVTGDTSKKNGNLRLRDITGKSGIYKIINKLNGKYYVGSSNDIDGHYGRWYEHKNDLKANRHENDHLQKSWNKYGPDAFEFIIVKETHPNSRIIEEQIYLNIAALEKHKTYNMSFLAAGGSNFLGRHHTEESKRKTSLKLMGRISPMKGKQSPTIIGDKNPRWKPVDDNIKNILSEIYRNHGYSVLKSNAKLMFNMGSTVTHRLAREFKNSLNISFKKHYYTKQPIPYVISKCS